MNLRSLAALASLVPVLGLSTAAFAQSFDASAGDGAALAQRARDSRHGYDVKAADKDFVAQGAPKEYARTIVCAHPPKESGLSGLSFFTGLAAKAKRTAGDDTASRLDDYLRSYVQDGKFHYDAWSCDTQDYWFTFDVESLLKTTPKETSRAVKGHARIETRGQVDWEGDLDCVANF
jgi:hypothetical protein